MKIWDAAVSPWANPQHPAGSAPPTPSSFCPPADSRRGTGDANGAITPDSPPLRIPGAETARKRFLLWKMFFGAKIAPSPPHTRRLCRFSKLSKFQSAKPASAKIARIKKKSRGNFCFLRQLHLQSAVTYVQVGSLACKFFLVAHCRLCRHPDAAKAPGPSLDAGEKGLLPPAAREKSGFRRISALTSTRMLVRIKVTR